MDAMTDTETLPKHPGAIRLIDRAAETDLLIDATAVDPNLRFARQRSGWTPITTIVAYPGGFHACGPDESVVLWGDTTCSTQVFVKDPASSVVTPMSAVRRRLARCLEQLAGRLHR